MRDELNEENINRIRVELVEKDNSLKFNLTEFRKKLLKSFTKLVSMKMKQFTTATESFNDLFFFRARKSTAL